jgi:hypothetical protein
MTVLFVCLSLLITPKPISRFYEIEYRVRAIGLNAIHFNPVASTIVSRSSGSIVSDYGLDEGDRGSILGRGERTFPLASVSRPALGPTQPPVRWVPGVLSLGVKRGRGVTLTTHTHLVPRWRMSRSCTSSPPNASVACSGTALVQLPSTIPKSWIFILLRCTQYLH